MLKQNIYIYLSLFVCSILILAYQNCGRSNNSQVPVANGPIVVDDFRIMEEDCSAGTFCKVTVVKLPTKDDNQIGLMKASITDEDIPHEFHRTDQASGVYQNCILTNRRDDIRFEYICQSGQ